MRSAEVVYADGCRSHVLNLGDVKGAGGRVADSNEFVFRKWLAVYLVKTLSRGVSFGLAGPVRQDVRSHALISSLRRVVHDSVGSAAEAFHNRARATPSRDVLSAPSNLGHLLCCRWNRYFDLFTDRKRLTTALFVSPSSRLLADKLVVGLGQLGENPCGGSDSFCESCR